MSGNTSNKIIHNDIIDFSVLKFFGINTKHSKVRPVQVVWNFF